MDTRRIIFDESQHNHYPFIIYEKDGLWYLKTL